MDNNMYMINTVHFVGYRRVRYNLRMVTSKLIKFVWWATEVALIIMIALYMLTGIK